MGKGGDSYRLKLGSTIVHTTPLPEYKETRTSTSDIRSPNAMTPPYFSVLQYSTLQTNFQRIKHSPLKIPLIKLGFLFQNHPQYFWKRIRTEGVLPTSMSERLERRFPKRKAPIFLI